LREKKKGKRKEKGGKGQNPFGEMFESRIKLRASDYSIYVREL
jgi:hypothetical protein